MNPNVQKILDKASITYKVYFHNNYPQPIRSPIDFANAIGYEIERITKSVYFHSKDCNTFVIAVCSSNKKMNLKAIAELINCKRIELATLEDLKKNIGYPPSGVSPLGIPTGIPIIIDNEILKFDSILIGSGVIGVEIELSPKDLMELASCQVHSILG